jgi:hypothetical protein
MLTGPFFEDVKNSKEVLVVKLEFLFGSCDKFIAVGGVLVKVDGETE